MTDTAPVAALRARLIRRRAAVGVAEARGLDVSSPDPLAPRLRLGAGELESVPLAPDTVSTADCVLIPADHEPVGCEWLVTHARLVFEARNAARDVRVDPTRATRL